MARGWCSCPRPAAQTRMRASRGDHLLLCQGNFCAQAVPPRSGALSSWSLGSAHWQLSVFRRPVQLNFRITKAGTSKSWIAALDESRSVTEDSRARLTSESSSVASKLTFPWRDCLHRRNTPVTRPVIFAATVCTAARGHVAAGIQ